MACVLRNSCVFFCHKILDKEGKQNEKNNASHQLFARTYLGFTIKKVVVLIRNII